MKRTLEQWQGCNPATMMEGMSKRGVIRTLEEARADILELHAELKKARIAAAQLRIALETVRPYAKSGVCCCGDNMNNHTLTSNHGPVDEIEYYIDGMLSLEHAK